MAKIVVTGSRKHLTPIASTSPLAAAYLASLLGQDLDAVKGIVRSLPEDRLAALRDTAIRLESALSVDRSDDSMCRTAGGWRSGRTPSGCGNWRRPERCCPAPDGDLFGGAGEGDGAAVCVSSQRGWRDA
jgi:hypothetical protein